MNMNMLSSSLQKRFSAVKGIPDIQKSHCFIPIPGKRMLIK